MINKSNLKRLANSSQMMKSLLYEFSKLVTEAKNADEYVRDKRKALFDRIITENDICRLSTETYQECVSEIYKAL